MAVAFVYFLRPVGEEGPVKIGVSTKPAARLETYLCWSPLALEIAATLPVEKRNVEMRLHTAFRHLHMHHEWFRGAPELTAVIQAVAAGTFDAATLPRAERLHPRDLTYWTAERREVHGLTLSAGRMESLAGVRRPKSVVQALARLRDGRSKDRPRDIALVRRFIADPLSYGVHLEYPWAVKRRDAFVSRKAA